MADHGFAVWTVISVGALLIGEVVLISLASHGNAIGLELTGFLDSPSPILDKSVDFGLTFGA